MRYPFNYHGVCNKSVSGLLDKKKKKPMLESTKLVENFMKVAAGRSLLFLGDSTMLQVFAAFIMILDQFGLVLNYTKIHRSHFLANLTQSSSMQLLEFYRVAGVEPPHRPYKGYKDILLSTEQLASTLRTVDIVILNIGAHYYDDTDFQLSEYKFLNRQFQASGMSNLILLKTLVQHFDNADGSGQYSQGLHLKPCRKLKIKWDHPSFSAIRDAASDWKIVLKQRKAKILDFTENFEGASSFHSVKGKDCTHYCYSPLLYEPCLDTFTDAVRSVT